MLNVDSNISYGFINKPFFNELYVPIFGHEKTTPEKENIHALKVNYVIHYILKGSGTFTINNITYHLSANDIFFIPANSEYNYVQDKDDPWEYVWFEFIGSKVKTLCENSYFTLESPVFHCTNPNVLKHIMPLFTDNMNSYVESLCSVSTLITFFSDIILLRNPSAHEKPTTKERIVDITQNYINQNYSNPNLSLAVISEVLYINSSYLSRTFKEQTGINISKYIISVRMRNARRLLIETNLSINDIATQTGYTDYHYFTIQFKKNMDATPTEYRKFYGTSLNYKL